ncbi:MAG: CoA transferase [Pseudomonadota bacterium]
MMSGPLAGVRVLDLSGMISGPLGAMILADQGADVIKVESPAGDSSRQVATRRGNFSASFLNNNRNKRSVVLDLKTEDGRSALLALVDGADVLLQNFRPGVSERLGIDYPTLAARNARLIYASITGFGTAGPYAHKPVFDPLVQALSGLTTVQAGGDDARPSLVRTIVPDKLTGFTVAQAICAALYQRERTGHGTSIDLSMLATVVYFLWSSDMGGHTFVGDELEHETAQSFIDLIFDTADGYISVAAFRRIDFEKLADAVGQPAWKDDPRFLTTAGLEEHKNARLAMTQDTLRTRTTAAWIEILDAHDVPHAPVLTRSEMLQHPQITANHLLVKTAHPQAGPLRQARAPATFAGTPQAPPRGGPIHGADTRSVLREAGLTDADIDDLLASGAAHGE